MENGHEIWNLECQESLEMVPRELAKYKRDEVMGGWRKLHNEEHHSLFSSPDIIRMIKSRRMRWAGHVACMRVREICTKFWLKSLKG
jgi:hypothetical protein